MKDLSELIELTKGVNHGINNLLYENANLKTHNDNQSRLIQKLEKENAELRRDEQIHLKEYAELRQENAELKEHKNNMLECLQNQSEEIEQLRKSQAVWRTGSDSSMQLQVNCKNMVTVHDGKGNYCTITLPPADVDPADKAWEELCKSSKGVPNSEEECFLAGFRAAQQKKHYPKSKEKQNEITTQRSKRLF